MLRALGWGAVVGVSLASPAGGQGDRVALVKQSDIIFVGTVTKVGAVAFPDVAPSPRTLVVRVDQVLEKPGPIALAVGDSVTVEALQTGSLREGAQATFYTSGWIFGRGVAVREVGHELARPQLHVATPAVQQESVVTARQQANDAELRTRIQAAAKVVIGRVAEVRPAALTATPSRPKRITEHDPEWQEAIIEVEDGIKGAQAGQRLVVRFPGSLDVAWIGTPRFTVGQEGTFLLQTDSASGSPRAMMAGQVVPTYTALQQLDVLPKRDGQRVRAMVRKP